MEGEWMPLVALVTGMMILDDGVSVVVDQVL